MRWQSCIMIGLLLACSEAAASATPPLAPTEAPPSGIERVAGKSWSFGASAYTYLVSHDQDYVQPTFTADRGQLHLEARYNYEDLQTGSTWIGWNLGAGESLVLEFTPIAGLVFGATRGIAPGYKGSLSWRKLELYSEGEHVFGTADASDSFFYNWSQLTIAPWAWSEFGVVIQRTRAYESERELQRGLLLGFSRKGASLSAIVFNPDTEEPTTVIALALTF